MLQVDIRRVNPYQAAIYVIGRSLAAFDDDHLIPTFGFGV
jgi:E3 ubiquitin-protein ligase RGLG